MVRKKMEGNEEQKRRQARDAHAEGKRASEMDASTGASKQRDARDDDEAKAGGNRGRAEHD